MESEEDFVGYENNDNISDENAFIEDVDDDDSETMTRQETGETSVKSLDVQSFGSFLTCWKMENLFNANCVAKKTKMEGWLITVEQVQCVST